MGILERLGLRGAPPSLPAVRADAAPAPPDWRAHRDSILNSLTGLGGSGDKGSTYNNRPDTFRQPLDIGELDALFEYNGLSRRIVSLPAAEACRKGWRVPDLDDEDKRLEIHNRVCEAMTWGRLYGAGIALMVTEDDVPPAFRRRPQDWKTQPLDLRRVGELKALQVFDAYEAQVGEYDWDSTSPTFRQPLYWQIATQGGSIRVHASRVLHFRGAVRPPHKRLYATVPDDSVLQAVWDEVQRLCSTMQGGAVLAHEIRESVLRVAGLGQMAVGDQADALTSRMRLLAKAKSLLGIVLIGEGDEYTNRGNPPTGFGELSGEAKAMLAGVLGWPATVLFGDAPSGLNTDGESGWQTFNRVVVAEQERNRPQLEQLYRVVYAAQDGPTAGTEPESWELEFEPLEVPTEKEQLEVRKLAADIDAIYLTQGVMTPEDVARGRFGPDGWQVDVTEVTPASEDEPTPEEIAAAVAAAAVGEGEEAEAPKADAATPGDGVCVMVPVARSVWEAARALVPADVALEAPDEPHVTVLYVGKDLPPDALDEVVAEVRASAAAAEPHRLGHPRLVAFPAGPDGTPIVVELDAWELESVHNRLLRALAHRVTAKQFPRFRAHMTIGYAAEMSAEARAALLGVAVPEGWAVPVAEVVVMAGQREAARVVLGTPVEGA
jgi:phage-related protein (TIGR01555 family)